MVEYRYAGQSEDRGDAPPIAVEDVRKVYESDGSKMVAVDNVSFTVEEGTIVGMLGLNGAGKTTLLKCIMGMIYPTAGTARIYGADVRTDPRSAYAAVGAVLEGARNIYWRLTARENMSFFADLHGVDRSVQADRAETYLELMGLARVADKNVKAYSLGMKQKAAIAATLAKETPILFLDEPTLGLDVETTRDMERSLRLLAEREGRTILLSSHDMNVIQAVCDRVLIIHNGRLVRDDTVDDMLDGFRTRRYRLVFDDRPPASVRNQLDSIGTVDVASEADRYELLVTLPESESFFRLVDVLERSNLPPVEIETDRPDLEDAFVRTISGSDGARRGRSATGSPSQGESP